MTFRFNSSLAHLMLRRLSAMMAVAVILAGAALIVDERNEARERQAELLEKVGVAMAAPLSESVWMVDTPLLERQLQAMTEIPGIAHVTVTTFIGQEFRADKKGYEGTDNFMVRRVQLRHQNEPLGQLEIRGGDLLRNEVGHVIEILLILITLLATALVGVYFVVGREVSRPLNIIASYLEKNASSETCATALMDELPADIGRELVSVASAIDRREQVLRGEPSQR